MPLLPLHHAGPFQIAFASIPLTHDLHSYDVILCNMFPQVVQPIRVAASNSKHNKKTISAHSLIAQPMYQIIDASWGIVYTKGSIGVAASLRCCAQRNAVHNIVDMLPLPYAEYYVPQRQKYNANSLCS